MNSPLLTPREAAAYLRLSRSAFALVAASIPCERPAGPRGDRRFRRSDLDAYSRSTRVVPAAPANPAA